MSASPGARLSRLSRSVVDIQPGEGPRVAWLVLWSAASVGGVLTVGTTLSDALFVGTLPASALPYLFVLPAVAIIPALLLYNRVTAHMRLERAIQVSNAVLLAVLVVFRFLLETRVGYSFPALMGLFLVIEISYTLTLLQFWIFAGQLFSPRGAKRLFGLIAVGGGLANVAAGFSLSAIVAVIGAPNLVWIVVVSFAVCILCATALGRLDPVAAASPVTSEPEPAVSAAGRSLRDVWRSPLLRAIGALTIVLSLLINVGAYQFFVALQTRFARRPDELAAYLGAVSFWAGLAALVVQFVLTGWVMRRFGVIVALAMLPVTMALGSGLSLAAGGALWAITSVRAADPIVRRTVTGAALNVLYLPLPGALRERAKEVYEVLYAAVFGLAGASFVLLLHVPGWTFLSYSVVLLALCGAWLALLPWTRRQYTTALATSLKRRVLDLEGATIDITDETTVQVLITALEDPDELNALQALNLIASATRVDWDAHVVPLLAHPMTSVRLEALEYVGRAGNTHLLPAIGPLLETPDAVVRAAAIAAYGAMAEDADLEQLTRYLADPDPEIRAAAAGALLRHAGSDGAASAAAVVDEMLASGDPPLRAAGARAAGIATAVELAGKLAPLFSDPAVEVRRQAAWAAGRLRDPELASLLIGALRDGAVRPAASAALEAMGEGIEPALGSALDDPAIGVHAAHILGRIGSAPAIALLAARSGTPDEALRGEVLRALARLGEDGQVTLAAGTTQAAVLAELRAAYALVVLREDLAGDAPDALLEEACQIRLSAALDRIMSLLNLLHPGRGATIRRVRQALEAPGGDRRATAIELLDTVGERQINSLLLPLVEAPAGQLLGLAQRRLGIGRRPLTARLLELADGPDPWFRLCAIHRAGSLADPDLAGALEVALRADDAIVRETALAASGARLDALRYAAVLRRHAADTDPQVRHYAQRSLAALAESSRTDEQTAPTHGGGMPLSTIERVLFLKRTELFSRIPSDDLVPVALVAREVTFSPGDVILRQGDPGDCLYIVVAGEVSVEIRGVGVVATRGARSSIGEMGLISSQPRTADCVATADVTALRLDHADFWEVLGEKPLLALGVISVLSTLLDEAVANLQKRPEAPALP